MEDEEAILVFLDQQKAFDKVEWGWVDYVLKEFNFGGNFRGWIKMLLNEAKTIRLSQNISQYLALVDRDFQ